MNERERVNEILRKEVPQLWAGLSSLGRDAAYPPDIPFQAAQARGKRYNATIGQITDGAGKILALPAIAEALSSLEGDDLDRALLYSPLEGLPELRQRWHEFQRPPGAPESSLPLVTAGLTHGLALVADLFGGPGRKVVVPKPFWGNYRQVFGLRTGAELVESAAYSDGVYQPQALAETLATLPEEEPALVVLNLPSNPGGYMPTAQEREVLVRSLLQAADHRPVVLLCDDAYAGLVYEDGVPAGSLFWELAGRHERLLPVRVSGSTKEFTFFGGRVGFLTFPFASESPVMNALESKVKCLLRAGIGSPVALSQVVLLCALRRPDVREQIAGIVAQLRERWQVLVAALEDVDRELLRPLPCNAGAFALLELADGIDPEEVRQYLLEKEDTGLVAFAPKYLRIAFCSVDAIDLPEVVHRLERGVRAIAGR